MFSLINFIRQGDVLSGIILILSRCFVVFCCLPIHEFAHGWVAYKLGDDTAKKSGRLSLNPFTHLDPIGALMIFLFGIGYARPVPVNIGKFKNKKAGMAITALAGPISNIIMAGISIFFMYLIKFISVKQGAVDNVAITSIFLFFQFAASVNVSLAVFNLIPIPPLDGSRVLNAVLPYKTYFKIMQYERYIMIGLFILLFTGILNGPISILSNFLFRILCFIPQLIFGV